MNRFIIIKAILILGMSIILFRLYYIQIIDNKYYENNKKELTQILVYGKTAPRGRIYDRNGVLLVDNKPNKVIYYKKDKSINKKNEINIAKKLSDILEIDIKRVTDKIIKDYYLLNNNVDLLTEKEIEDYKNKKITNEELKEIKYTRIDQKELDKINKEEAYIYYLMNNGYSYEDKIIKDVDVTDYEYANVAENSNELKGVGVKLNWEREYKYDDTFKNILGSVGSIPKEMITYYTDKGYKKDDIVGTSYLEYQYDDYLKGEKNTYLINTMGDYEIKKEGSKGNDLYLTIDINLQKQIEDIIINNLINARNQLNTSYLNKSFVIVSNPKTGEILAMAGKQIINGNIYDFTPGIITTSYVVGSTVKGASHIVGYNTGALKIGEVRDDSCIKIKSTNEKCSWKYLGNLNDITALKYSSNTYQFRTAIKVSGASYTYNGSLKLNDNAFNIYRNTFKEFGLGSITGIDLPNEKLGYSGNFVNANLLLNFSIGQYDTYTPIELSQYVNTIANSGIRVKPFLVNKILSNDGKTLFENKRTELNNVNTKSEYINRVREGFKQVMELYGTGYNYINPIYNPAGKTGTSQSFVDSNLDGKIDTETISTAFIGYAPYNDPTFSIAVITPDVSDYKTSNYVSPITRSIVRSVSDLFFSIN
ncbi:MAG TPA: penicillin-binding protein 2 [Bacilli bacterium]|nr:penicillin-binding protein 2 [Bacilli bacterium]